MVIAVCDGGAQLSCQSVTKYDYQVVVQWTVVPNAALCKMWKKVVHPEMVVLSPFLLCYFQNSLLLINSQNIGLHSYML